MVVLLRCYFFRADHHGHAAAFHGCVFFNSSMFADRFGYLCKHDLALFFKLQLAPAEDDGDFHLVSLFKECNHMAHLHPEIMLAGERSQLDFLGLRRMMRFFLSFFALLVLVFTEIHHAAHRRINIRRYLDKVTALLRSHLNSPSDFKNAQLGTFFVDDSDAGCLDSVIDPLSVVLFFYVPILLTGYRYMPCSSSAQVFFIF